MFSLSTKCCLLNFLVKEFCGLFPQNMNQHKLFSTLKIIINASWAANLQIGMISEGSCDTVDWSNADLKKNKKKTF